LSSTSASRTLAFTLDGAGNDVPLRAVVCTEKRIQQLVRLHRLDEDALRTTVSFLHLEVGINEAIILALDRCIDADKAALDTASDRHRTRVT